MIYGSVCSGIEAATVAWHRLGWRAAFFAEIDRFPSAVLKHHYAGVPNHGDFTTIERGDYEPIDLLVGGTPCQDFSVAGLRAGMDGKRGQLTVEFAHLAGRLRPRWLVWENVPGVLSIDEGRAFGTFLGMLGKLGYGVAYRVLDAQYFGVPQRRRRVFVVGHLGDWRRAAAVLFERQSLSGHPAPRREAGQVAPTIPARSLGGGGLGTDFDCDGGRVHRRNTYWNGADVADTLDASNASKQQAMPEKGRFQAVITHALRADGFDASEDGTGRGTPLIPVGITVHGTDGTTSVASYTETASSLRARVPGCVENSTTTAVLHPVAIRTAQTSANGHGVAEDVAHTLDGANGQAIAFSCKDHGADAPEEVSPTLRAMSHDGSHANAGGQVAVAFESRFVRNGRGAPSEIVPPLKAQSGETGKGDGAPLVATAVAVRRLTPRECERLQGFPDDYTLIRYHKVLKSGRLSKRLYTAADGPRYKALGNSMAVPCMQWIGERIAMVDALCNAGEVLTGK